jgi:hypothetical protein
MSTRNMISYSQANGVNIRTAIAGGRTIFSNIDADRRITERAIGRMVDVA